jgi:uncharacterized protein YndB with AHSA1/START domain
MLGAVRYSSEIARPADEVWAMVGEPERIGDWFPDFASATVEGSTRTIVTKSGMTFDEQLLIVDPILRRLQYRLDLPIISYHRGTIDVIELAADRSLVIYATECDPRIMALVIGSATKRALDAVTTILEEEHHG